MEPGKWLAYLEAVRGDDNDANTAAKMNISQSTFTRWRSGAGHPKPQQVVEIARLYSGNTLSALHAAGYINLADITELGTSVNYTDLSEITTTQLLDELQNRLRDLRDTFDTLERTSDRAALEAVVEALSERHLPESNVVRMSDHRATPVSTQELIEESLADKHAALHGDNPAPEQEAPDTA